MFLIIRKIYLFLFRTHVIYVKNKRILMILLEFILTFDCEETRNEKNRKHEESIAEFNLQMQQNSD